jgi:hypothetical protein
MSAAVLLGMIYLAPKVALSQPAKPAPRPNMGPASQATKIASGILVKVEGDKLTIKAPANKNGAETVDVTVDGKTIFIVDYDAGKLSELKPGMTILSVSSVPAGHDHPALTVVRAESPKCRQGRIADIDGTNVIVNANMPFGQKPKEITVPTDEKTRVLIGQLGPAAAYSPARLGTLDDLAPGMLVRIFPDTGTAAKIWTHAPLGMTPGTR